MLAAQNAATVVLSCAWVDNIWYFVIWGQHGWISEDLRLDHDENVNGLEC